jgi:hypothetical protein
MVCGDDGGGRDEHPPVAVEREERERAEDVEVGLDAAAREMYEQRRHQHLPGGYRVARRGRAGVAQRERDRQQVDRAAEKDRRPDVEVNLTRLPDPGARRDDARRDDARDPLQDH